jgi:DNA-binding NarL/FixJ family response regulator
MTTTLYKLLIADDHAILRDGIRSLIMRMRHVKIVGEAANGQEAIDKFRDLKPDLLILDISMPDINGMEVARVVLESSPDANIIILSMFDDEDYINRCLELGVKGYVAKNESGEELELAIESVLEGKKYFSSQIQKVIFGSHSLNVNRLAQREKIKLTQREMEIIQLISEGLTSQEMADKLFISPRTVDTHRANLLKKLAVKNSMELINKVDQLKLLKVKTIRSHT